jgi:hypothetical protein
METIELTQSQLRGTINFHERAARALKSVGREKDAEQALKCADKLRKLLK